MLSKKLIHVVAKRHKFKGGSLMRKMQRHIAQGKRISVGLEDPKSANGGEAVCAEWGMIVHETSLPAEYNNLRNCLLRFR